MQRRDAFEKKPSALTTCYLISSVIILSFAIFAKLTAHYSQGELQLHDPFIPFLTVGQLLVVSVIVEIIVIWFVASVRNRNIAVGAVLWLTILLIVYRVGFAFSPEHTDTVCKCFGGSGGIIGKRSDELAWLLLAYLFLGGCIITLRLLLRRIKSLMFTSRYASIL